MDKKKTQTIKIESPHHLANAEKHSKSIKEVTAKKPGRKKLPPEQKASETVTLKLTPAEKKIFDSKAGYVPPGTFLKNYLKENTDLLG